MRISSSSLLHDTSVAAITAISYASKIEDGDIRFNSAGKRYIGIPGRPDPKVSGDEYIDNPVKRGRGINGGDDGLSNY